MDMQSLILFMLICFDESTFALFRIRPSASTSMTMTDLGPTSCGAQEGMHSCFTDCLNDPCCLSVKLSPPCEISYLRTEELDMVKEVSRNMILLPAQMYCNATFHMHCIIHKLIIKSLTFL